MIVLPDTPPLPVAVPLSTESPISAMISPKRLSIPRKPQSHSDCVKYIVAIEEYLDDVFQILVTETDSKNLRELADLAGNSVLYHGQVPWENMSSPKRKGISISKSKTEWTLAMDLGAALISASLMYTKLGADLINRLIEQETQEVDSGWKSVAEYYKKALGRLAFATEFLACSEKPLVSPLLIPVLERVCNIGIQLSILSKSSWMNRTSIEHNASFSSTNNGVLCRVAIWIMNEISVCKGIFTELELESGTYSISPDCDGWVDYAEIFSRYVTAYSGLFLSIEYYQKGDLGSAIGLVHFSLISLQEKQLSPEDPKHYNKLKNMLVYRKNHNFVANLHSLTALKIDKSVFHDSAEILLNDLFLLFDQLVFLRLKFTKENDNLRFEPVSDWKDIMSDTRWPVGTKIPTSAANEYFPKVLEEKKNGLNPNFKGQYF